MEAEQALFGEDAGGLGVVEPAEVERFLALAQPLSGAGAQEEADIVVLVRGLPTVRRNRVDVDVEREKTVSTGQPFEVAKTGLLARFAKRYGPCVGVAVGVATELQPTAELAMVGEQEARRIGGEDPARSGDVPRQAGAREAVRARLNERRYAVDRRRFPGKAVPVAGEEFEQGLAMHERTIATRLRN